MRTIDRYLAYLDPGQYRKFAAGRYGEQIHRSRRALTAQELTGMVSQDTFNDSIAQVLADHAGDMDKVRTRVSHGRSMMSGHEQATVCEQLSSQVIVYYPREEALVAIVLSTAPIVDDARRAFDSSARLSQEDSTSSRELPFPDLQMFATTARRIFNTNPISI